MRYSLSQDELAALGRRHGASLTDLSVEIEYEDHPPELRITQGVSALFPSLSSVSFNCVNVAELDLKMPELQSLRLENARGVQRFRLDCPQLERMTFEFVEIQNARDFGPSVGRSPKLEALHAYKVMLRTYRWRPQVPMVTGKLHSLQVHFKSTLKQPILIPSHQVNTQLLRPLAGLPFMGILTRAQQCKTIVITKPSFSKAQSINPKQNPKANASFLPQPVNLSCLNSTVGVIAE